MVWLVVLMGCTPTVEDRDPDALARYGSIPDPECVPPPPSCPPDGLDYSRCVADSRPFTPIVLADRIVSVHVEPSLLPLLGLPPGSYFTSYRGLWAPCARVVVDFEIESAP